MRELSIFIDESGDFGAYEAHAPVYLVTLVFHDQAKDISVPIEHLQRKVAKRGLPADHAIHTGPLVRRESEYREMELADRRKLFRHLNTMGTGVLCCSWQPGARHVSSCAE